MPYPKCQNFRFCPIFILKTDLASKLVNFYPDGWYGIPEVHFFFQSLSLPSLDTTDGIPIAKFFYQVAVLRYYSNINMTLSLHWYKLYNNNALVLSYSSPLSSGTFCLHQEKGIRLARLARLGPDTARIVRLPENYISQKSVRVLN